jgi:hypothetical protein
MNKMRMRRLSIISMMISKFKAIKISSSTKIGISIGITPPKRRFRTARRKRMTRCSRKRKVSKRNPCKSNK